MSSPAGAVDRFAEAASQFCELVESPLDGDRAAFVHSLRSALAEALAAGHELPDVEPCCDADPDRPSHAQWRAIFTRLQTVIGMLPGGLEDYVAVPDDLADVWRDLRPGLDALKSGACWEDVTWEWKSGLQMHWGRHAEHAVVALRDA